MASNNANQFRGSMSIGLNNVVLKSALNRYQNMFNFAHLNTQSLCRDSKFEEFKRIFLDVSVHAIAVSESWFKQKDTCSRMNVSG